MNRHRLFLAVLLTAGGLVSSANAAAALLYQQVFNPPPPDTSPNIGPWSVNAIGGYSGTFDGSFDAAGIRDADNGQPIGRTGPADTVGTAVYIGVGGPVTDRLGAFYTVDGQADFSVIDPATCPDNLYLNVWANTQQGGADDYGYFIVQAGPGGRDPSQWYISSTPMATPTVNQGATFNLRSLLYDPAAGNWNNLTLDPTNTVAPVIGGPAGSLAGLLITGVGVLQSITNPAPNDDFSNDAFSSWNYADFRVTCGEIPEPSALLLLALAAPAGLLARGKAGFDSIENQVQTVGSIEYGIARLSQSRSRRRHRLIQGAELDALSVASELLRSSPRCRPADRADRIRVVRAGR